MVLGQFFFFLRKHFCSNKCIIKELCHGDFKILRSKLPKLKLHVQCKYLCHIQNGYRTLKGRYQEVNSWRENKP